MALGDWKIVIGNGKMDLLAGNMHFSKVFGGRGPGTCVFPKFFDGPGGGRREGPRPNDAGMPVCWPLGGTIGGEY